MPPFDTFSVTFIIQPMEKMKTKKNLNYTDAFGS